PGRHLPPRASAHRREAAHRQPAPDEHGRGTSMTGPSAPLVLYVDDEPTNRLVFQSAFGQDFRVQVAPSAAEALERMKSDTVGVVLADQRMPDITGVELLAIVKDRYPDAIR